MREHRALLRALLGYLVADIGARAGGVFALYQARGPWRLAQTERFDQAGDNVAATAWAYRRGPIMGGRTVRLGSAVVIPLYDGTPHLRGVVVLLDGGGEGLTVVQRTALANLAGLVAVESQTPPLDLEVSIEPGLERDHHRAQLEAALTASRGVVAQAARILGRPARTVWDQLRRHGIRARTFKPGAQAAP